jgi:transcriptional regulator with XRE-family HTH domain
MEYSVEELLALGTKIKEFRKAAGLSQEELAESSSIDRTHLIRIETGAVNPSYLVLKSIANALQVDLKNILP